MKALRGSGLGVQASVDGGMHPIWRGDGEELFYLGPNDEIMAVDFIAAGGGPEIGAPRQLFRIPLNPLTTFLSAPYDVAPDGQRFLLNVPDSPAALLLIRGVGALIDRAQ